MTQVFLPFSSTMTQRSILGDAQAVKLQEVMCLNLELQAQMENDVFRSMGWEENNDRFVGCYLLVGKLNRDIYIYSII